MSREQLPAALKRGAISWMARNSVAANLLMAVLIIGGFMISTQVKQEVFPEFDLDFVAVSVLYPGASPDEVEKGIVLAIEEEVRGLDGVKRVTANASEGMGTVYVELMLDADKNKLLNDIKSAVDGIASFPIDAERPNVSLLESKRQVISVILFGEQTDQVLHELAERVRADLLADPGVTQVELSGVRPLEVSVEIPRDVLRAYGLTLEGVSRTIGETALELPGGGVKTASGEVLLRMSERRERGTQFADISVLSTPDGGTVKLGDIATILDGFQDNDQFARFDGLPAVRVQVFRVGEQTPIEVADTVKAYVEALKGELPPGVFAATWNDDSRIYRERIDLLLRNAVQGLILVMLILGLFLEPRLAFWVTLGIPISFLGAFLIIPNLGVSINMISLFAFIITLGLVVDDAIVVGENIYERQQTGMSFLRAAILGAREISVPVTFSILTSVAAFSPLLFVPGVSGKLFRNIPAVVISVLLISLVESLFVLPAHLSHLKQPRERSVYGFFFRQQQKVSRGLQWGVERLYAPLLRLHLRHRYVTVAVGLASLAITIGYIRGGHIDFTFLPRVEGDIVTASAKLPFGAPVEETEAVQARLVQAAQEVLAELRGERESVHRGVYSEVGTHIRSGGAVNVGGGPAGGHLTSVQIEFLPMDERDFTSGRFVQRWRERVGELAGVDTLTFSFTTGPSGGAAIDVQLVHPNTETLEAAALDLSRRLGAFAGVKDIDAGFSSGKPQVDLRIREEAEAIGLTSQSIARQVRAAFFGAEAIRQQRGRNELRVYVRYPESERRREASVDDFLVTTAIGGEIPLRDATDSERGRAYTLIKRSDGQRVLNVTADIVEGVTSADKVIRDLRESVFPALGDRFPGLTFGFEGEQKERNESLEFLGRGFLMALLVMFCLLAIPFKSYVQPLIVMTAIPFGLVGALGGHVLLGFDLSVISMMGVVALSGVVVNDSLVLIDAANRFRRDGMSHFDAITAAGIRRFRPILLTSLTTFGGLMPMIFETSVQARFLVPMAISLGFGVLFATFVILIIVPSLFLIVEDVRWVFAQPGSEPPDAGADADLVEDTDGTPRTAAAATLARPHPPEPTT